MGDFRVEYFGFLRGCESERNLEIAESAIERLRLWVKTLKPKCYNRESVTLRCGREREEEGAESESIGPLGGWDREYRPSYWSPKSGPTCGFRPETSFRRRWPTGGVTDGSGQRRLSICFGKLKIMEDFVVYFALLFFPQKNMKEKKS